MKNLSEAEINVCHPIIYDTYNLCELHAQGRLAAFKVTMLKEICKYFELKFSSRAIKCSN